MPEITVQIVGDAIPVDLPDLPPGSVLICPPTATAVLKATDTEQQE